jgi:hypothetical protein
MAAVTSSAEPTLSLSGIARALDLSYPKAISLRDEGILDPDFIGPHNTSLYLKDRLPELRKMIQLRG